MAKYTLENIEIGERQHDGSRFVSWVFCVDGDPYGEPEGVWVYGWKTSAEIGQELKKQLRNLKVAYELNELGVIEL